jgi:aldehyde dehydrogenase (NAD+)
LSISELIKAQKAFFRTGKSRDRQFIKSCLRQLREEIIKNEDVIFDVLQKDFKKPPFETYLSEIGIVISEIDLILKNLNKWSRPKRVRPSLLNFPSQDFIYSEPYGSVLVISPWNYPFQLSIAPVISAVAAGNTVVLKPSELTTYTSQFVEKIISKVFKKEHVAVIQGDARVATELLAERWDYIFFTGSVPVGKIVAKAAADHLTPVTLELGGKTPCIVDKDINVKLVAKRIVWGKFLNSGQTCIAPDYLLVNSEIKSSLMKALKHEILAAYGEDPEQSEDFARIINAKNFNRLRLLMENKSIIYGGQFNAETNYLSPTLVDDPSLDSDLMTKEIFGPILPILSYSTEDEINDIIMNIEKPLAFYMFSNDRKFNKRLIKTYSFGGGVINDTLVHFGNHRLPFGGVGESGIGAYHGKLGFETFRHKKAIVKKGNWLDIPIRYAPYSGKLSSVKALFKWFS